MADNRGRVPPQNLEAEQAVLGAILVDNGALDVALEIILKDDFYHERHRVIFEAMLALADRRAPIDAVTLCDALRSRAMLEQVGDTGYIAELVDMVPGSGSIEHYARIVRECAVLRAIAYTCHDLREAAYGRPVDIVEFADSCERRILEAANRGIASVSGRMATSQQAASSAISTIHRLYDGRGAVMTGTPSGFTDLDLLTQGFQGGDLIVIAARPGMGKTAIAVNIAEHAALERKLGVVFFTIEMSMEQLTLRMICGRAGVDMQRMRTGYLREHEFALLARTAEEIGAAPLRIDESSYVTPAYIKAGARRMWREFHHAGTPLGLVIVDYLQIVHPPERRQMREREIADITASLKALAKELHVPVLALSQLNRGLESRSEKRPMLADLRESGAIEQDADVIAFIYRDEVYNRETKERGIAEIIVGKQRNGPTDTIKLAYEARLTRFSNLGQADQAALG